MSPFSRGIAQRIEPPFATEILSGDEIVGVGRCRFKSRCRAHGFRASASTILNERGYDPRVIEAAHAHVDQNAVRRAYNTAQYWSERVKLLQGADLLDQFKVPSAEAGSL